MGTTPDDDLALMLHALHQTRQRVDLLQRAVVELLDLHLGRGIDPESRRLAVETTEDATWLTQLLDGAALEPDHAEGIDPHPLPHTLLAAPGEPDPDSAVVGAQLAGARRSFDGTDPLAELRAGGLD